METRGLLFVISALAGLVCGAPFASAVIASPVSALPNFTGGELICIGDDKTPVEHGACVNCQVVFGSISAFVSNGLNCEPCQYTAGLVFSCGGVQQAVAASGELSCGRELRLVVPCYGQPGVNMVTIPLTCGDCE
jgi:hypothetical protein